MTTTVADKDIAQPPEADSVPARPWWAYPGLALLLVGTAVAYLINLSSEKWGNAFYAAAVQAGSVSWKAFLFGSSDAGNSITVDKPPASLWVMEISVRIFGLNYWSVLAPQVLIGVISVGLVYAIVRKRFGYGTALFAGLIVALTPTAALMFRYDNPDALLVLTMIAAGWAMLNALEGGRTRWLLAAGAFVGLGFLTKQLEALLILPALAIAYFAFGPPKFVKRVWQLLLALLAMLVALGWWVAIVQFTPARDRPWVGGSDKNSIIDLTFGYNGFGRLTGSERPGGGGGGAANGAAQKAFEDLDLGGARGGGFGGFGGQTGITRLFATEQGGQIAWLIPAALILAVVGIAMRGKAPRTDFRRAWFVMWGIWLVGAGLVFSYMSGTFHSYYTDTLTPAIAAIVAVAAVDLWKVRDKIWAAALLAVALGATVVTAYVFLARTPTFQPWLKWAIVVLGVIAILGLLARKILPQSLTGVVAATAVAATLAGPTAYVIDTIATPHSGGIVSAGPATAGGRGGFGNFGGGAPGGQAAGGGNQRPGGQAGANQPGLDKEQTALVDQLRAGFGDTTPTAQVTSLLEADASKYTWVAATVGSNGAAGYQLATQDSVMPIGGFSGSDPSPSLSQFEGYVQSGRIHYFIGTGGGGGGFGGGRNSTISTWVTQNYAPKTVDGVTLYDLTVPAKAQPAS